MKQLFNEEINAARAAIRDAVVSIKDFTGENLSYGDVLELIKAVIEIEGVPPPHFGNDHAMWNAVRKLLRVR